MSKYLYLNTVNRGESALLAYLRKHVGKHLDYTQETLAEELGISRSTMSTRLKGETKFTHPELCQLFRLFRIPEDVALSFFGFPPKKDRRSA